MEDEDGVEKDFMDETDIVNELVAKKHAKAVHAYE